MITDHRARYVIFEFKNYGKQITQAEIYSTEKYLLPLAMRSTAIIVSRLGVNKTAYRVMAGALREAGKVMISVSLDRLCEMLHRKDRGEAPSEVIADELEALLTGLER